MGAGQLFNITGSLIACPGVNLSEGSLVRGLGVHLFGGSLVRGFACPSFTCLYFSSTMTFLAEIEAVLMKRILTVSVWGRHSQESPLPGRCCSAGIYMGDAVLLKNI